MNRNATPNSFCRSPQQVHDLGLDRDVERGDRLVGHEQLGLEGERAGDPDALALTAGELVGVPVVVLGVETHDLEQLPHPVEHLLLRHHLVHPQRGADDRAHRVPRVQRAVGVLEDHLDLFAVRQHLLGRQVADLVALELHRARGGVEQPRDEAPGRRLAAARLADQAQRRPRRHLEGDPVDRLHLRDGAPDQARRLHREVLAQVGHLEQRLLGRRRGHGGGDSLGLGRHGGPRSGQSRRHRSPCIPSPWATSALSARVSSTRSGAISGSTSVA